ncbi:hypothetical protein EJD97_000234, partial [Solanum chilense]
VRGRKMSIMTVGSSVGAQVEALDQQQAQSEGQNYEDRVTESAEIARRLSLDTVMEEEEAYENSDLMQKAAENKKESNGTVTKKQDGNTVDDESEGIRGEEVSKETMVQLEGKEVQDEEDKWKCALIAYVVGEYPGYNAMNRYIMMNWSKWCSDFDFGKEFLAEIPLWVNFPRLPLNCWGVGSLSRITSAIGVPLFADECTTKQTRISYARMMIEVDVTKAIPQQITVADTNGRTFVQEVVMEWKPHYCDKCQKIGHQC